MPSYVLRSKVDVAAPQALGDAAPAVFIPEMVGRNCRLGDYDKRDIPKVRLNTGTEIIAYASPDLTYAVTKKILDAATHSILIGIYDFSAGHVREVLLAAMARGVKVSFDAGYRQQARTRILRRSGRNGGKRRVGAILRQQRSPAVLLIP